MKTSIIAAILTLFSLGLCTTALGAERMDTVISDKDQHAMLAKARQELDRGENLPLAGALLEKILQAEPENYEARFERARYLIKSGYINYKNFEPGSLEEAREELTLALKANPKWGQAYVLLGHIDYLEGNSRMAINRFKMAESLKTDYPWLYLNWADALIDLHDWQDANVKLQKANARSGLPKIRIYYSLLSIYDHLGWLNEADKTFKKIVSLNPNSAQTHGNYAAFLLEKRGLPDESIRESQKALSLEDYGMGHLNLGTAQYVKWAQLRKSNPVEAENYLKLAKENAPDLKWVLPNVGKSVSAGPALQNFIETMLEQGYSIDMPDDHGDTAFTLATATGNIKSMEWLAKHGANINYSNVGISSPLVWTIHKRDYPTMDALIAMKVDLNLGNKWDHTTPLMEAVSVGDLVAVKKLVKAGADWRAKANGEDAMYMAKFYKFPEIVSYLSSLGAQ